MPRAGVAWDLRGNGNTIFRGGVGLFYSREAGNAQYGVINVPPNAYAATLNAYAYSGLGGGRGLTYTTIGLADPFSSLNSFNISSVNPDELEWPRLWNTSVSVARRLPWRQTAEVGYVGSFGRHLAAQRQFNVIPVGGISSGIVGNADLSNPLHRAALQDSVVNSLRPFPALQNVTYFEPIAETNYNSMQATLSRPAGSFQYFVAYTLSKATGNGHDFSEIDALDPSRSETVMPFDRRHIFNVSWTWMLGTPVEGNAFLKALANDWNLSGISTFTSGVPIRIAFNQGDLSNNDTARAWWGTSDFVDQNTYNPGDITPLYLCDPRLDGNEVNEKRLDVNCLGIPNFGETGPFRSPYDLRSPWRSYHDLTVFKNFSTGGDTRLQFRAGFFNLFNQAYPWQSDIDLNLETACNVQVSGVPDGTGGTATVCDPTAGFHFTDTTLQNFGRIITKRGHRVIEFALRFFW
jgi:hypothetical protein